MLARKAELDLNDAQALRELAQLVGVQTAYYDVSRKRRQASLESLLLATQRLGAPVNTLRDAPEALRAERERISAELLPPAHAMWDGEPRPIPVQLPENDIGKLECRLVREDGEGRCWTVRPDELSVVDPTGSVSPHRKVLGLELPAPLPHGYHCLEVEGGKVLYRTLILSAPRKAFQSREKVWGIFVPPYALCSERSWGAGSFSDLETTADWLRSLGGRVLATLPMLAAFLEEPFDHSPYAPVSRLFWSEFYIDVERVPELEHCARARTLCDSGEVRAEIAALRAARKVDYRRLMRLKRRILELLARDFFASDSQRRKAFNSYIEEHPAAPDYAKFRAVTDRRKLPWSKWPEPQRAGALQESEYDATARDYHLYAQWLAHEQVHELGQKLREAGSKLYLDLPLGAHADGYDVWRHQDLFITGMSAGAPPDTLFTRGQSWGFPPIHPRRMREEGYAHFLDVVRHHLRSAGILRIDHVMALHRLFCIPEGAEARDGVYVRYPAEELYAVLAIESQRHAAMIVGENLGTVPQYVNESISARGLQGMYVMQYELTPGRETVFPPVPRNSVASTNTHDMPPFAAYWRGMDIAQREELGLLDVAGARLERRERAWLRGSVRAMLEKRYGLAEGRTNDIRAILEACLAFLSGSPARVALVNLEDLWLETKPQNVPGTGSELPNWRRKLRYTDQEFSRMHSVLTCLERVDSLRTKRKETDD